MKFSPAAALMGHIKAGRMRALAISAAMRSPLMPELPTIAEAGVPGYEYTSWNGIFVPRGTPRAIIAKLHAATQKALAEPDVKQHYANQGLAPLGSTRAGVELGAARRGLCQGAETSAALAATRRRQL